MGLCIIQSSYSKHVQTQSLGHLLVTYPLNNTWASAKSGQIHIQRLSLNQGKSCYCSKSIRLHHQTYRIALVSLPPRLLLTCPFISSNFDLDVLSGIGIASMNDLGTFGLGLRTATTPLHLHSFTGEQSSFHTHSS